MFLYPRLDFEATPTLSVLSVFSQIKIPIEYTLKVYTERQHRNLLRAW